MELLNKIKILLLAKRRAIVGSVCGSPFRRMVARIACRVIDAAIQGNLADLDMLARLQALLGAKNVSESQLKEWSRNPKRGLQKAKNEFFADIPLDPDWFAAKDTGIINRVIRVADMILGDNVSLTGWDIVINFLHGIGFGREPSSVTPTFYAAGKSMAKSILDGSAKPSQLGGIVSGWAKKKVKDAIDFETRRQHEEIGVGREEEDSYAVEIPSLVKEPPKKRKEVLKELMAKIPRQDKYALQLDSIIKRFIARNSNFKKFQIVEKWYEGFRDSGDPPSSKELGKMFGVLSTTARTSVVEGLAAVLDFLVKDDRALNIADSYMQAQELGYGGR